MSGQNNLLLVATHDRLKDDDYTNILAEALAEELNCYAVINDKYRRPRSNEKPDVASNRLDLNVAAQAKQAESNEGFANVTNCTFTDNEADAVSTGDGIHNTGQGSLIITNTILTDNGDRDYYNEGTVWSAYNIVENHFDYQPDQTDITGEQAGLNLGPLADNGGLT